jgi:predicted membrane protein
VWRSSKQRDLLFALFTFFRKKNARCEYPRLLSVFLGLLLTFILLFFTLLSLYFRFVTLPLFWRALLNQKEKKEKGSAKESHEAHTPSG